MRGPDPRYVAPAIDGYIRWSNFEKDGERVIPMDDTGRMFVAMTTASRFDIPVEDVRVEAFTPQDGWDTPVWVAYVKEAHAERVATFHRELNVKLRELTMLMDAMRESGGRFSC